MTLVESGTARFIDALGALWQGVVIDFLPKLLLALFVFIVGWVIADLIGRGVAHLIKMLNLDKLLGHAGFQDLVAKAGFKLNSGRFIGGLVKWFFIIIFLVVALDIVQLSQVNQFLNQVLIYLPNVIIAALILLVGSVVADLVDRLVEGSARAAGVRSSNLLGKVTHWAIWIFAIIVALAQLGIAAQFIQILFTGVVAMLALAGGLAFGLGGKDAASKTIEKVKSAVAHGGKK